MSDVMDQLLNDKTRINSIKIALSDAYDYYRSFPNEQSQLLAYEFKDAMTFYEEGTLKTTEVIELLEIYEEHLRDSEYRMRHRKICDLLSKL